MANQKSTDLELAPVLDLNAAPGLRDALTKIIDRGIGIRVDFSTVERITTPCVQVIMAAKQAFGDEGLNFSATGLAPSIRESFQDLGFAAVTAEWGGGK